MKTGCNLKLVLQDGRVFTGISCGAQAPAVGEIVFNTSMVGYQEILSDPAYAGQIVVMTYPLIGQYGIMAEDYESRMIGPSALVVRECCPTPSNFRFTKTLSEELEEHGIPCLAGVDTRMLTRIIREEGSLKAAVVDESVSVEDALKMISAHDWKANLVSKVSCSKRWFSRTAQHSYDVVVVDCGMKHSVVSALNRRGCNVTVVPFDSSAEDILAFNPDGVIIAGGPSDPSSLRGLVDVINSLKGKVPVAGIGLGHILIALSYGASSCKMKSGFHGGRAIRDLRTGRIVTAEHNQCFTVEASSLKGTPLKIRFTDVATGSVAGIECLQDKVFGAQFYPEGGPGPEETDFFDDFVKMMED